MERGLKEFVILSETKDLA